MRNLSDEKKCVILLALTIFMGILLFYTYIGDRANDHEGIIRLHVIANSNTVGDQSLKLKVRDAVIAYMNDQTDLGTVDKTREHLEDNLKRFEAIANGIIAAEGYNYTAKADIGIRYIPEKSYGDITFPAGNYEALNITLGEGDGENWWCVLFPPLCLLDEGTESAETVDGLSDMLNELSSEELDGIDISKEDISGGKISDEELAALSESQRLQLRWKLIELLHDDDQTS